MYKGVSFYNAFSNSTNGALVLKAVEYSEICL